MEKELVIRNGFYYRDNCLVNYSGNQENVVIPDGTIEILDPFSNIGQPDEYEETDADKIRSIMIPASVTKIDPYTFTRLYKLETIQVDKDNKKFSSEDGILYNKRKTELISFPQKCKINSYIVPKVTKKISSKAFWHNSIMEDILLPEGLKRINPETFYGCNQLKSIAIPESVTSIGKYACYNCNLLHEITLSGNITQIGYNAFMKLTFGEDQIGAYVTMHEKGFTIRCPKGSFAEQYAREHRINIEYID